MEKTFDNCCNMECSAKKYCERFRCTAGQGCYEWAHGNGKFYFNDFCVCINPNRYGNASAMVKTAQLESGKWVFGYSACSIGESAGGFASPCMFGKNCLELDTEREAAMQGIKAIRNQITLCAQHGQNYEAAEDTIQRIFDNFNQLSLF